MAAAILIVLLLAAGVAAWRLTYWGAREILLSGGFRRPLSIHPDDFGLACERVRFRTSDGLTLAGWFIPARAATDRTLLLCHGWGTNKGEILPATHFLAERYNLFFFDFRFCGESEGDLSSVGYLESRDFDAALDYLRREKPRAAARVGAYGLSMGAATAFMATARHPDIRAAVIENPFSSFTEVCKTYAWHKWRVPYYPLIALCVWHANRILGVDQDQWSPVRFAPRIARAAVFFIHAQEDPLAPPAATRRIYDLVRGDKELWIVPDARHEDIHEVAKEEYRRRILNFYERYL